MNSSIRFILDTWKEKVVKSVEKPQKGHFRLKLLKLAFIANFFKIGKNPKL